MLVAFELTDDVAVVEPHDELPRDLVPPLDLLPHQPDPFGQTGPMQVREGFEHLRGRCEQPRDHHVRVGVVAETLTIPIGILGVELVGSHHSDDLVAIGDRIPLRDGGPEPRDLEEHLGAIAGEELHVPRDEEVHPGVVGDCDVDVTLAEGRVGDPVAGLRIQVHDLALLSPVAPRLPREHRPVMPGGGRGTTRRRQPPEAVPEKGLGDLRDTHRQHREDEQLVPEDVTAVGLPVESPRRNADVTTDRVR